jgi:hypothetical protein
MGKQHCSKPIMQHLTSAVSRSGVIIIEADIQTIAVAAPASTTAVAASAAPAVQVLTIAGQANAVSAVLIQHMLQPLFLLLLLLLLCRC